MPIAEANDLVAYALAADHALNPLALPGAPSRLSWKIRGSIARPLTAYIEAASSRSLLLDGRADIWWAHAHPGCAWVDWPKELALDSRDIVWWRVQLQDSEGTPGTWSLPATFEVALTCAEDWSGRWITHPSWHQLGQKFAPPVALPRLTRSFSLGGVPIRARLYTSGLGVAETFINNSRVGEAFLEPGYADYAKHIPASAWDVTAMLKSGPNTIDVALGTGMSFISPVNGRYTKLVNEQVPPQYLAQLEIFLADGQIVRIATDTSWQATLGNDVLAHWYGGQDDVQSQTGNPAYPEDAAQVGSVGDFAPLWWKTTAPIRIVDQLSPTSIRQLAGGGRVYDFGTNIAGQIRAEFISAIPGQRVEFWPGELLRPDGHVDQTSTGYPIFDSFTPARAISRFEPTLVYHGFRYVEVRGLTDTAPNPRLTAVVLRADLPRVGVTETSSAFINTLHSIIDRAVQSNMYSVFTDCPHREKLGWIEELYLCFDTLARGYDVAAHLQQGLALMRDAQLDSGLIPSIAPEFIDFSGDIWRGDETAFRDDPNWGGAIVFLPWKLYTTYADRSVLTQNWEAITHYLDYLATRERDGILDHGLGDWIAIDASTPRAMVATFGYQRMLTTAAKIAHALDLTSEASTYELKATQVLAAFVESFGRDGGARWGSGSQASYALALDLGAVPEDSVHDAWTGLLAAIDAAELRISVGENALPSLLRVLSGHGRDDMIDLLIHRPHGPGYAHQIDSGATALTESWQGPEGPSAQGSQNHFMLGMIDDWITGSICGLRQAKDSIGWQRVNIEPRILNTLEWAHTSYLSPAGEIDVRWDKVNRGIVVAVALPPGVSGELRFGENVHALTPGSHTVEFSMPADALPDSHRLAACQTGGLAESDSRASK